MYDSVDANGTCPAEDASVISWSCEELHPLLKQRPELCQLLLAVLGETRGSRRHCSAGGIVATIGTNLCQ